MTYSAQSYKIHRYGRYICVKNIIYIFIFDGRKRCTSFPKEGEGGGNLGNARKKTFIFKGGLPLSLHTLGMFSKLVAAGISFKWFHGQFFLLSQNGFW